MFHRAYGGDPGLCPRLVGKFLLTVLVSKQACIDGDDALPTNQHARPVGDVESENQNQSQGMNASASSGGGAAGVMAPQALLGSSTCKWDLKACFFCFLFSSKPPSCPEVVSRLTFFGTDSKRR